MRKGIKEALLRVTEIVNTTERERSQKVRGHDKACEKFHLGLPSAAQLYHAFETRRADQENARRSGASVPISNRDACFRCLAFPAVGRLAAPRSTVNDQHAEQYGAAAPQWQPCGRLPY